jgi:Lectin C-type domain
LEDHLLSMTTSNHYQEDTKWNQQYYPPASDPPAVVTGDEDDDYTEDVEAGGAEIAVVAVSHDPASISALTASAALLSSPSQERWDNNDNNNDNDNDQTKGPERQRSLKRPPGIFFTTTEDEPPAADATTIIVDVPMVVADLIDDGWRPASSAPRPPHDNPNKNQQSDEQQSRWRCLLAIGSIVVIIILTAILVGSICGSGQCSSAPSPEPPPPTICDIALPLMTGQEDNIFNTTTLLLPTHTAAVPACTDPAPSSSQGMWYSIIGTGGVITVSTCDPYTSFPASVAVYHGSCDDLPTGGDVDFVCETIPTADSSCDQEGAVAVNWLSMPGQSYYILVRGTVGTVGGNFGLTVKRSPPLELGVGSQSHAYAISANEYTARESFLLANSTTSTFRVCGRSGQLATVTSEEENNLIWELGKNRSSSSDDYLLLGGMQDQSVDEDNETTLPVEATRGWSWLEEGSFAAGNFTGDLVINDYANWHIGEPDQRKGDNEDCVTMYTSDGQWHDRLCDVDTFRFVLEFDFSRNGGNDDDGDDGSNTITTLASILDGCSTADTTVIDTIPDPLISVRLNEGGDAYVCRYLSDAIDELVPTTTATTTSPDAVDDDVESRLMTLLNSLSSSLTPEQITIITECVTSSLME